MSKVAETLRSLAEKARRKDLPRRHELVAVALELGAEAMEATRTFVTKDGDAHEYDAPQMQAANKAIEIAASLALKFERPEDADQPAMSGEAFASELEQRGLAIVHKATGKPFVFPSGEVAPEGERIQ